MKVIKALLVILLILLLLAGGGLIYLRGAGGDLPLSLAAVFAPPSPDPQELNAQLLLPTPAIQPVSEAGRLLQQAWERVSGCTPAGELQVEKDSAVQPVCVATLDTERLGADLTARFTAELESQVAGAARRNEIYNEDRTVRRELLEPLYAESLQALLGSGDYTRTEYVDLQLRYADRAWTAENAVEIEARMLSAMSDPDAVAAELFSAAVDALPYIPLHYSIPEDALAAPIPDPAGFGETDDPAVIEAQLQRPEAQALINGQELCWNAQIERIPVLVWQETEAQAVGTFSEVFIADGSQLRRKIAGDELWSFEFRTTSRFAAEANAVLTLGGDFYYHGRACGVGFYQRELYRFEPDSCDDCYITADGDMLFSYRGQFSSEDEARQFVKDNNVLFSLCFGPVLIDNGVDVTPSSYAWGEIDDTYARSALGMLGDKHYLTMNINCQLPDHYYLATLRQAADAMVQRGCLKAYTLDGGQTATTVFHNELINPVQFGWEKDISDVIYFATAVPNT